MATITSRGYSTRLERYGKERSEADSGTAPANLAIGATGSGAGPILSLVVTDDDTTARAHPGTGRRYRLDLRGVEIERLARHLLVSDILGATVARAVDGASRDRLTRWKQQHGAARFAQHYPHAPDICAVILAARAAAATAAGLGDHGQARASPGRQAR